MSTLDESTPLQRELHAAHLARREAWFPSPVKPVEIAEQPRLQTRIHLKRVPVELTRPIEERPVPNRQQWARSPNAVHRIISACATHYRVTVAEILSDRVWNPVVRPRQIAMYLAKNLTPHSLPMLGGIFRRDHTTVLFAVRKIERLIPTDPKLHADVEAIKEALAG